MLDIELLNQFILELCISRNKTIIYVMQLFFNYYLILCQSFQSAHNLIRKNQIYNSSLNTLFYDIQ